MITRMFVSIAVAVFIAAFTATGASAKTCKATLKEKKVQLSESQARKAAIAAWSSTAKRKHGASFANWSNANNKKMNCKQVTAGKRQQQLCIAIGKPCSN